MTKVNHAPKLTHPKLYHYPSLPFFFHNIQIILLRLQTHQITSLHNAFYHHTAIISRISNFHQQIDYGAHAGDARYNYNLVL